MCSPVPPRLHLINHKSMDMHFAFVEGELLRCLRTGAMSDAASSDVHRNF